MAKYDPEIAAHQAWLGLLQPVGLVVSPPALVSAQAVLDQNVVELQQRLIELTGAASEADDQPRVDLVAFVTEILGWQIEDLAGAQDGPPLPELEVVLAGHGETLRPTHAAIDSMGDGDTLLLLMELPADTDLDAAPPETARDVWHASPQARFERLLRETQVAAGLIGNGRELRLVYAPRGESSGHLTFPLSAMVEVSGRPILAALHMLLSEHRVFSAPDGRRIGDLLVESREYQSEVSTKLSEQVLGALWELLRGFQAADEAAGGRLLYDLPREDPGQIYGGLLTVLMRLVSLLYAEDEGLTPDDEVYIQNYSVAGLHERLRADAGLYPDTMDQRHGAWAGLLTTFRLIFDGGGHGGLRLPTRHGQLFNPDEYPFLEGRPPGVHRSMNETVEPPRVSDGVVWRVLEGLLVLDGERLSYRALDVEQIGSVYEAMMGFEVQATTGRAIAVRPKHVVVDLDALLAEPPGKRVSWLKDQGECKLEGKPARALKSAETVEDLVAALGRRVSPRTPNVLPPGALFLQPGEERRRSGSHYTPRELTQPIVETALRPVLKGLGEAPTPEQILDLKVCDPAMGSGAFLVEACRQLAEQLVAAWEAHESLPGIWSDEEPLLHARRLVAQRCLYGVDKNPFAVHLAKLSLWLVTLARDHAFTFLDHALKCGDSLVGLTCEQIGEFAWDPAGGPGPLFDINTSVIAADGWREKLQAIEDGAYGLREGAWREAEEALADARLIGDAVVAAFFDNEKARTRETERARCERLIASWQAGDIDRRTIVRICEQLRGDGRAVRPFHWELEFPEVFGRANPGFDAIVGNPPFLGGKRISTHLGVQYRDWLSLLHCESSSNADLVAHFLRRAFNRLRAGGCFGLIATNTIAQGDTRKSGLQWICQNDGAIYSATKRLKWPGAAAVVVSVIHVQRSAKPPQCILDDRVVPEITAFLFHSGGHEDPHCLHQNQNRCFIGTIILGMGFTFDDADSKGDATPLQEMHRLIEQDPRNAERILPYIGGREVTSHPRQQHHRYVINFENMPEEQARGWPDLYAILEQKVKPRRAKLKRDAYRTKWWQFGERQACTYEAIRDLTRALVIPRVSMRFAPVFIDTQQIISEQLVVIAHDCYRSYAILASSAHELWFTFQASTFGSSDAARYTPTRCFQTFPFPENWQTNCALEAAGKAYYEFRADLMARNDEGLTKTYNRFHDPDERGSEILRLRELHAAMDREVLDAYGWTDIPTSFEFLLDYEIDEATWSKRKKKPYRYRWPEEVHDKVLARLLELNQKRHDEEVAAGPHDKKDKARGPRKRSTASGRAEASLFSLDTEDDPE